MGGCSDSTLWASEGPVQQAESWQRERRHLRGNVMTSLAGPIDVITDVVENMEDNSAMEEPGVLAQAL